MHTDDGRMLEVFVSGARRGVPVLYHSGTPTAAAPWPLLDEAAAARGHPAVTYSRPGYAESSPHEGRRVAHAAADVAAILDHLGAESFITFGWSGGGPHALACAALLSHRCLAAASVAGVAPFRAVGLDWLNGMGVANIEEFTLALRGADDLTPFLLGHAAELASIEPQHVADALTTLVSSVDRVALTSDLAEYQALSFRRAVSQGVEGWLEDDLAFAAPWGFNLSAITTPVSIWQGGDDLMVPSAHGAWLANNVAGARRHLYPEEGHLSLGVNRLGDILDDLDVLAEQAA